MIFPLFFFGAFVIAFLLPNHYYPWGSFYLEFSAFIALFVAISTIALKKSAIKAPLVFLLFALFSLIPLAQWAAGLILFRGDAILFFFYLAAFALSLIASFSFASESSRESVIDSIGMALLFIGIVSVWIAMIQWLQLSPTLWIHNLPPGGRPYANLAQPNNYSSLIWISLFSLFYLFERKRVGQIGLMMAGMFLVAGAALAQSRTSWLIFFIVLFVVVLQMAMFRSRKWSRLALPVCVAILFYLFSVFWAELANLLYGETQKTLRTGFTSIRTDMWWAFSNALMERPWFGFGWGQGSIAQVAVAELYPPIGLTQYTHNLVLDLMIWNGIPIGIVILAVICVFWLGLALRSQTSTGFYSICAVSALLVHALLEYPHAYSYFLLLAGFFIGCSAGSPIDYLQNRIASRANPVFLFKVGRLSVRPVVLPRSLLIGCVAIYGVALTLAWRDYRILEEDHRLLRFEVASIGMLKAEKKAPDVVLFDQLRGFTWVARTKRFDDLTASEVELLEKIALRYPLPMPLYKLAQLRVAQGRPADADASVELIKQLYGEETFTAAQKGLDNARDANRVESEIDPEPRESAK